MNVTFQAGQKVFTNAIAAAFPDQSYSAAHVVKDDGGPDVKVEYNLGEETWVPRDSIVVTDPDRSTIQTKLHELTEALDERTCEMIVHGGMALACSKVVKQAYLQVCQERDELKRKLDLERRGHPYELPLTDEPMDRQIILLNRQVIDLTNKLHEEKVGLQQRLSEQQERVQELDKLR